MKTWVKIVLVELIYLCSILGAIFPYHCFALTVGYSGGFCLPYEATETTCDDGCDNDRDGLADGADSDCSASSGLIGDNDYTAATQSNQTNGATDLAFDGVYTTTTAGEVTYCHCRLTSMNADSSTPYIFALYSADRSTRLAESGLTTFSSVDANDVYDFQLTSGYTIVDSTQYHLAVGSEDTYWIAPCKSSGGQFTWRQTPADISGGHMPEPLTTGTASYNTLGCWCDGNAGH